MKMRSPVNHNIMFLVGTSTYRYAETLSVVALLIKDNPEPEKKSRYTERQ